MYMVHILIYFNLLYFLLTFDNEELPESLL